MNCSDQHYDSIATVQLSPFGEGQWHRIVTYSPMYVHWSNTVMTSQQKQHKSRLNVIVPVDINSLKLQDEVLLNELHDIRRAAAKPSSTKLKGKKIYDDSNSFDGEQDQRTTSPADEYQRSSDFFYQTRESYKHHCSYAEPSFSHQTYNVKRPVLQNQTIPPQTNSIGPIRALPNISLGAKPQASLSVQLRQSAIAREHALANDQRSTTSLSLPSAKRAAGSSAQSRRRPQQQQSRLIHPQTPPPTVTRIAGGLYEQLTTSSSPTLKRKCARSTNTSRTTIRMLKTKNDRARKKQNLELKTILVNPCRQPTWNDGRFDESIPNSIEMMRKSGGPITAFERNLKHIYHQQLNQFRNNSVKC